MAMKNKALSVSKDFIYNISASVLLTGVMQIVVYPLLAYFFDESSYGLILTVMGITNTTIVAFGNTLNNLRLILNSDYEENNYHGDFQALLCIACLLGSFVSIITNTIVYKTTITVTIALCLISIIAIIKSYYCVEFRLLLNFKHILCQNIFGTIGYLLGVAILSVIKFWPLPFLVSELIQLLYILGKVTIVKEKLRLTPLFKSSLIKYIILIGSGLTSSIILYLDRIIIYPLIGSEAVSVYSVASVFGKALGIVMTPIAGVLLGYYAQNDYSMTTKKFWGINVISLFGGLLFICISILVAPFFTRVFYPSIYETASHYIFIANLAATISVVSNLTQSAVLKFAPTWLQIIKELVYGVFYVFAGIILLDKLGLMGFCVAAVIANIAKLITLYIMGTISIDKLTKERRK